MPGGLSLGYRKGRHRGTWIAKRYSAEHGRKLLELATFLLSNVTVIQLPRHEARAKIVPAGTYHRDWREFFRNE